MTGKFIKKVRSLLAFVIAIMIMVMSLPLNAIALDGIKVNEDGYIEVDSIEDLYLINKDLTANYILTADIDMTEATAQGGDWDFDGRGWSPIGSNDIYSATAFSGIFDGNGYKIIGMRIHVTSLPSGSGDDAYLGLFSSVSGVVKNLRMEDVSIYLSLGTTNCYTGSISAVSTGEIYNCSSSGSIEARTSNGRYDTVGDRNYVGGIIGENFNDIYCCYNETNIIAYHGRNCKPYAAGIVGMNSGEVVNCYNVGTISSTYYYIQYSSSFSTTYKAQASAIANNGTIKNCYNLGTTNQYAVSNVEVANCYYVQSDLVGITGAKPLTKGQMKLEYMYEGFDFENVWVLDLNAICPYPQLRDNPQDIRVISNVSIAPPTKTSYYLNENLDLTGCTIEFEFENAECEVINVTADMVTGFDAAKLGEQELTVTYYDREITFTINVSELPYKEIWTIEDLYNIRNDLTANYILMNDIDLTEATAEGGDYDYDGRGWNPIGSNDIYEDKEFSGVFNGNGYSIIGMRIHASPLPAGTSDWVYVGLFSKVTGFVHNLKMRNVSITHGGYMTGAIAGYNSGIIESCAVDGDIVGVDGTDLVSQAGGIVGRNDGRIQFCFNLATLSGAVDNIGGIAGRTDDGSAILDCYNAGNVSTSMGWRAEPKAGGVAGYIRSTTECEVRRCYNVGVISNGSTEAIGYCYYKGDIVKHSNNYFLTNSGTSTLGATALTDAQMRIMEMFPGFDFENVWMLNTYANYPYPQLRTNIQDLSEAVSLVSIIKLPNKTEYFTGDSLEFSGSMVKVVYASGREEFIEITKDLISGFDMTCAGEQTVTVTVAGVSDTYTINVTERPIVSEVSIASEPTTKTFVVGTAFNFSGAMAKVLYEGGIVEYKEITVETTTGGNINHIGKQTITYTFEGISATFIVEVVGVELDRIVLTSLPNKLYYLEGQDLDVSGMVVTAVMNNGYEYIVETGYSISGYDTTAGKKTGTVNYNGVMATFSVEVEHIFEWVTDKENNCGIDGKKHEECSVCHTTRSENTVIPSTGNHTYTNDCDTECNVCLEPRQVSDHIFDNACDTTCNVDGCDYIRTITHDYEWVIDEHNNCGIDGKKHEECSVCHTIRSENTVIHATGNHSFEWVIEKQNNCGVYGKKHEECTVCHKTRNENTTIPATGNHTYTNDCDTECNICFEIRQVSDHIFDNACDTECNVCNAIRKVPEHVYDNDRDAECNECGYIREVQQNGWVLGEVKWNYYIDGVLSTGWQHIDSAWYYFDDNGIMQTGWQFINHTWYYLTEYGNMVTGWHNVGPARYYFSENGAMLTGWLLQDGAWYFFSEYGNMVNNWQLINGRFYYFIDGEMQTGWLNLDGTWYYFAEGGNMATGWLNLGGTWYYMAEGGNMVTGWLLLGNTWYYFADGGNMLTGWQLLGGTWYLFADSGAWIG